MSKVAHYLQEHLIGEVMTSTDARRYFATDASILEIAPALVVYPRNENDVRKTARFTWQLAERGRVIPITARGSGTDQYGAAIGSGIMLVFPAHMHRILEIDTKAHTITVEPGIIFGKMQQTLKTHGRFVPSYPASLEYSTVGGAIANNASGEKSIRYGTTRTFVHGLRVVLANGEVIETGRINKRELNRKLGLATYEGEIYRSIDALIEESREVLDSGYRNVGKNNAGYDLSDVKRKDGSFDLTPLFVGSQGTLGIITEAILGTTAENPEVALVLASFDSVETAMQAIVELRHLHDGPSMIEMVDGNLLQQAYDQNPNQLKNMFNAPFPPIVLLLEFDGVDRHQKKQLKRANKILGHYTEDVRLAEDAENQQLFSKIRQISSTVIGHNEGLLRAVPIIDDAAVPFEQFNVFLNAVYELFKRNNLPVAIWGHIADANIHMQPKLNLGQVGDRQKAFRMMDEFYKLVISMGGTISSETGDGRIRTPYLEQQLGTELYGVLKRVKQIFDPYGTLNPGVKFGSSSDDIKALVRQDYAHDHIYDHLPRS